MKPDAFSTRLCSLDPNCRLDLENVDLLNQIVFYGMAGTAGVVATIASVVYAILAVRKAVAIGRQLLGMA